MNLIVCKNYEEVSAEAAKIVFEQIKQKPDSVLGLATGSTPEGLYANMIRANQAGEISFRDVRTVNLDEYYPIRPENDQSYRYFMNQKLFLHIDIDRSNTHVPDGTAADPQKEGLRYEQLISDLGGIDLQVLGIGQNGHIGFNEPDTELDAITHKTDLTPSTIAVNSRFFASEEDVPKQALTMGMRSILNARKIILLACGKEKHTALQHLLNGKISTHWPASLLNLHSDVTVICDTAAREG